MKTLFLFCQDPYSPERASWSAYACFDHAVGRKLDVRFDMPFGHLKTLLIMKDPGGVVAANGRAVSIDSWEDIPANFLRLRVIMSTLYAATVAEGLSRLSPLLEAVGARSEVTECLLKNL